MSATLAELIEAPQGTRFVIPWSWLTSNSKKSMEIVFQFAFDEEQDFSRGFAIHHLRYIQISDVKAIKYLDYKHVLMAVEEIQKIVHNAKYSELPTVDDTKEAFSGDKINSYEIYEDMIRKASNLEDLADAILNRIDAEFPMSERDRTVVCARAEWYTSDPQTLDSIGRDYGLTRERIRQISKKFEIPMIELTGELRFAKLLSQTAMGSKSFEDFQKNALDSFLTSEEDLDISQCESIMKFLSGSSGWQPFLDQLVLWRSLDDEKSQAVGQLTKFRSKMGFIDAAYASKNLGFTPENMIDLIKEKYPRSISSKSIVLARTGKIVSTFEAAISKQLTLCETLSAEELLVGARRHASLRNDSMPADDADYIHIIHSLCGNPPTKETFLKTQLYETDLSESDKWLIEVFNSSQSGLLHRVEITKFGIDSGMNLGSITAYCGSSPFIRPHSNGVYSLIGIYPDPIQVATHAELALAQDRSVEMTIEFEGSNVALKLLPNLNTYASGVLLPSREIKEIFTDSTFSPFCTCGPIESKQVLRLSKEGFWMGFQSIFAHALQKHSFNANTPFQILFDFDQKKAILNP
jgi:hypothetical protein